MAEERQQTLDRGRTLVDIFIRRAKDESYRTLAEHLALADLLTPELVSYIHNQFLFKDVEKFEAGADILLSDLCRLTGPEQYSMDPDVREYLLESMESRPGGAERKREVAGLLLGYLTWFARRKGALYARSIENQRLGAMMYIDEERKQAVTELVKRINACLQPAEDTAGRLIETVKQAEVARICRQIENFSRLLSKSEYSRLVDFARDVRNLLDGEFDGLTGPIDQRYELPEIDIELPALDRFIPEPEFSPSVEHLFETSIHSHASELGDAYDGIERQIEKYHSAANPFDRSTALSRIAEEFRGLEKYDESIRFYEAALEHVHPFEDHKFRLLEAGLRLDLADVLRQKEDYQPAIDHYTEAIRIYHILKDDQGLALAYSSLGLLYFQRAEWRKAKEFLSTSVRFFSTGSDEISQASILRVLSETNRNLGEYPAAIENLEQTLTIYRKINDLHLQMLTIAEIGNVYDLSNQKEEALKWFQTAQKGFSDIGDRLNEGIMFERASIVLDDLGRRSEAIDYAESAYRIFSEIDQSRAGHISNKLTEWRGFSLEEFTFTAVTLDEYGKVTERMTARARQFIEELASDIPLFMVEIPGGEFLMGTSDEDATKVREEYKRYGWPDDWVDREIPQHKVSLSPFYIGKFQITQDQWRIVAGWPKIERDLDLDPSHFKDKKDSGSRPVEQINWHEAEEFCARLAKRTGRAYRLPTEAEWEYACRAGTTTPFAFGETITPEFVNYDGNYPYSKAEKGLDRSETIPVGSLGVANAFGLFDMHGNVWEWCGDWYGPYSRNDQIDPTGPDKGTTRGLRGGSWFNYSINCRSAYRNFYVPDDRPYNIGLRVVVSVARTR